MNEQPKGEILKLALFGLFLLVCIIFLYWVCSLSASAQNAPERSATQNTTEVCTTLPAKPLSPPLPTEPYTATFTPELPPKEFMQKLPNGAFVDINFTDPRASKADLELAMRIVQRESGDEPYLGQLAVAQSMYDRLYCLDSPYDFPETSLRGILTHRGAYAGAVKKGAIQASCRQAVEDVFLRGVRVSNSPIHLFYAPKYSKGSFHRTQTYVLTIGGHKFYKMKSCRCRT